MKNIIKSKGRYWYEVGNDRRPYDLCECGNFKSPQSKTCQACCKGTNIKEKNGMWKGDEVKYGSLHDYIEYHKPKPRNCENCGKIKKLELANISQEYKRDINDYEWICRSCHMNKDGRLNNIHNGNKKITSTMLLEIKDLYFKKHIMQKEIAKKFGVNKDTIWLHLKKMREEGQQRIRNKKENEIQT